VDDDERLATDSGMEQLSLALCGGAEIGSKRIGGNHDRRMKFLQGVEKLSFSYYALVVNKDRLAKDSGLQFKASFYKFMNRMLYRRLASGSLNLHIVADTYGGKDFMDSFQMYLDQRGLPDLFSKFTHEFALSENSRIVQLADLIAGTLSYCFDEEKRGPHSKDFRKALRAKEISIESWPLQYAWPSLPACPQDSTVDKVLWKMLSRRAHEFINEHEESPNDDKRMQAATLKKLLFARIFEDGTDQALFSDELITWLQEEGFEKLSKQPFTNRVIGKLRDAGIILAGSNDGYRLALTSRDIEDYIRHDKSIIEPMLRRLLIARDAVKNETKNTHDILETLEHKGLCSLVNQFRDSSIEMNAMRSVDE